MRVKPNWVITILLTVIYMVIVGAVWAINDVNYETVGDSADNIVAGIIVPDRAGCDLPGSYCRARSLLPPVFPQVKAHLTSAGVLTVEAARLWSAKSGSRVEARLRPGTRNSFRIVRPNCIGNLLCALVPILVIVDSSFHSGFGRKRK